MMRISLIKKLSLFFTAIFLLMAFDCVVAYGATNASSEAYGVSGSLITADCINNSCQDAGDVSQSTSLPDSDAEAPENLSAANPETGSPADPDTETTVGPGTDSSANTASESSAETSKTDDTQSSGVDTQTLLTADIVSGPNANGMIVDPSGLDLFYGYDRANTGLWSFDATGTGLSAPHLEWLSGSNNWDWSRTKAVEIDRDGDGNTEIAALYGYDRAQTGLWLFDYTPSGFAAPQLLWLSGENNWEWGRSQLAAVDNNGDGKTELALLYEYDRAQTGLWLFDPTVSGFSAPRPVWFSGQNNWEWGRSRIIAVDNNGDARSEIAIFYNYNGDNTGLWLMDPSGSGYTAPRPVWFSGTHNWDWSRSKLVAADNNGDGRTEIAVLYAYDRSNTGLWLFDPSGSGYTAPHPVWFSGERNWDWSRSRLVAVDVNSDGMSELAVLYGYDRGQTGLWLFDPSGAGYTSPHVNWLSGERNWEWLRSKVQSGDHFRPKSYMIGITHLEINLSSQTLTVVAAINNEVAERYYIATTAPYASFLVCTGRAGSATPTGLFTINSKYVANDMSGGSGADYYYAPAVPYVLWFIDKMYSIHGAPWVADNQFGVPRSHGCVNLQMSAAAWLFERVPVGMQVWIHY